MIAMQPHDALALAATSFRLTYGQLNERSAGLAQGLQLLGVGPGVPIAVFAHRTFAGILGALAVLKAGAAYAPLDPADPPGRLDFILRDLQAPFVLAERGLASRLPKGAWKVIPLDEAPLVFSQPVALPASLAPDSLACVLYTSGPHGRPLGVEITHAGLLNLVRWHQHAFKVTAADNASQLAPPGSESAVWEIWPYLAAGASLHFPDPQSCEAALPFREWLVAEYITMAFAPSALASQLIAMDWPRNTALRVLLTSGGDSRFHPPAGLPFTLVNTYGTVETTMVAASGVVLPQSNLHEPPAIGRPIDNVSAVLLNKMGRAVRDGEAGELCIGGAALARGYWNQPELSARRFAPCPPGSEAPAFLFHTGDAARRLPGGEFALLGRLDDRITIRGYRVEPAEIESALNAHPEVKTSVVVAREDGPEGRQLAAYIVLADGAAPSIADLQVWLRERLPAYMLPAAIAILNELPLTPQGETDRAALPAPWPKPADPTRRALELRLLQIITSLLPANQLPPDETVVRVGGQPLLAALVIDRVRQVFGVTLNPRQLFEAPTVAQLAAEIERTAQLARC